MSETICAVCKIGKGPEKCEICGFSDNGKICGEFLVSEDANHWLETVVKPYRDMCFKSLTKQGKDGNLLQQIDKLEEKIRWQKLIISLMAYIKPSIGRIVPFGGHDWRILDVKNGTLLLLSEKILFEKAYHKTEENITWEHSDLRKFLNNDFFNKTFTPFEKEHIAVTINKNNYNTWFNTNGGLDTIDKIFPLSMEETVYYFGNSGQLAKRPYNQWHIDDFYNSSRAASDMNGNTAWWLLRTPGHNNAHVVNVYDNGQINAGGRLVKDRIGIRPALWLIYDEAAYYSYYGYRYGYYPGSSIFIGNLNVNP